MMKLFNIGMLAALLGLSGATAAFASGDEEEFDAVHHTADGYYLDFSPLGKVELPRIFLVRRADGSLGLDVYGSSAAALRSQAYVAETDGGHGEADHGEADHGAGETAVGQEAAGDAATGVQSLDAMIESGAHLDAHLVPAQGHILIDFSMTRHLIFALLGGLIVILIFTRLARRYQRGIGRTSAPRGIVQNLAETLIIFVRDDIARPNLGERHYKKFLPYLLTIFFFILVCNLLGLVPFGATATSNLMITAVLATFTFVLTQLNASKDHWRHVFWPPGVPWYAMPFVIPPEIVGLFTKPIALAIRLFANMTAGHLVILSLVGLIFIFTNLFSRGAGIGVVPISLAFAVFVSLLEVLIAFIQAYIFTILSALFIGMAVQEHDHEAHAEAHAPAAPDAEHDAPPLLRGNGTDGQVPVETAQTPSLTPAG